MSTAPLAHHGISASLLRRCTALAAQARIGISRTQRPASHHELLLALEELASWPAHGAPVEDPMLSAVAAAALEDLRAAIVPPAHNALGDAVDAALAVLRG